MVKNKYIPKQGDIVLIDLNPTIGHEQKEKRPAIILSTNTFNKYTKMAIVCPITSNIKEYPTHLVLKESKKVSGAVLLEHVRSIDYESRNIKYIESASDYDLLALITLFNACIEE